MKNERMREEQKRNKGKKRTGRKEWEWKVKGGDKREREWEKGSGRGVCRGNSHIWRESCQFRDNESRWRHCNRGGRVANGNTGKGN